MDRLQRIQKYIFMVRGVPVILDKDLAALYHVETKVLNQAVKRNAKRFPADFMFQLSKDEIDNLKSQNVTSSWGGTRKPPSAFTEQGIAMLSGILNSDIAIAVNIQIMRAFVKLRHSISGASIDIQLEELRKLLMLYIEKNDKRVNEIIMVLNNLVAKPVVQKPIGFRVE